MPAVVNDNSNRVLAKGIRLWVAGPTDTEFRRVFGLKGVNGLNFDRVGEVDATELYQGPTDIDEAHEEQFFFSQQYSGTKKIPPIELSLNKVPKMYMSRDNVPVPIANQCTYITLADWYTHDKICHWSLRTRTGYEFAFLAQIDKIPMSGEEGNLWNGVLSLMPNSWIIYRPVPTGYAPWGTTNPKYGPPGVGSTTVIPTWDDDDSATLVGYRDSTLGPVGGGGDTGSTEEDG